MTALTDLLRSPARVAERCREDRDVRELALVSLGAIVLGAAVFGAAAGSFRGGAQIALAAAKIPLALVATLAIAAPTFHALAAALGRPWPMRTVVALALAAAGRSALVLLALSPILWLVMGSGLGYHQAVLACVAAYAVAGSAALGILVRGLGAGAGRVLTLGAFVAVFFAVGGQTAWTLRPYLGRPKTTDVPVMRAREGSFADAVYRSSRSAVGVYDEAKQEWQRNGERYELEDPGGRASPRLTGHPEHTGLPMQTRQDRVEW